MKRRRLVGLAIVLLLALAASRPFLRPTAPSAYGGQLGTASTPPAEPKLPQGLELGEIPRLVDWMTRATASAPPPSRNIFRPAPVETESVPAPGLALEVDRTPVHLPTATVEDLKLTGFIVRPRADGAPETLAVLRIGGEVYVVGEGELAGAYRLERIILGEEVVVVEAASGTRRVLRIE